MTHAGDKDHIIVPERLDGKRLDSVVAELLPRLSRSAAARLIEEGKVSIDGLSKVKRSTTLSAGARLVVVLPEPVATSVISQNLPLRILYEDDDLAAIDKPAGLVVHPAAGHADRTLVNALLFHLSDLSGIGGELRPGIVHRLDKDTSGVMVVAKHDRAHRALTSVWSSDAVRKEYLAIVYGTPQPDHGRIEQPIGRDPRNRKKMAVVTAGRTAVTRFEIVRPLRFSSLLRCRLETGRTHQIRVHLKSIGHPIIGDPLYSGPQWRGIPDNRLQRTISAFPRQALHAASLTFPHPRTGEPVTFTAPVPADMQDLIDALRVI